MVSVFGISINILLPSHRFMIDEQGGGVAFSTASVFIQFPKQAVSESVVFTCTLVRHNDCPVKPTEGEVFCSSIIKIEPQGFVFEKPVTVLLSHSAVEKGAYTDYYDLTVQQLGQEKNDLKTTRISKSEGIYLHYILLQPTTQHNY